MRRGATCTSSPERSPRTPPDGPRRSLTRPALASKFRQNAPGVPRRHLRLPPSAGTCANRLGGTVSNPTISVVPQVSGPATGAAGPRRTEKRRTLLGRRSVCRRNENRRLLCRELLAPPLGRARTPRRAYGPAGHRRSELWLQLPPAATAARRYALREASSNSLRKRARFERFQTVRRS